MKMAWLEELLPDAMVSPRTKALWALFFLLFPLAYVGGILLERTEETPARMMRAEDRSESIRTAAAFAASKGFDVSGWHQYAIAESHEDLLAYYGKSDNPALEAASELSPAREIQVLFRSPDQSHEFRVYLSLDGQITGFDFGKSTARNRKIVGSIGAVQINTDTTHTADDDESSMKNAIMPTTQEAESIARSVFVQNQTLSGLVQLGKADVENNGDDPARREVSWDARPTALKGLTLHITASVRDGQVVAQHISANLDDQSKPGKAKLPAALYTIYGFFLTFGAVYAMWRYAKRTLQKEVSHWRTLVVAGLFAISYGVFAYSFLVDQIAMRVSGETFAKFGPVSYGTTAFFFVLMGLLVGIGYGCGEGEVREAYPGKLTSLDALLAGRVFSRDVAASILFGAAVAGWLLLIQNGVSLVLVRDVIATRTDVLNDTFARLPWLTLLVGRQYDSLLIAVTGLLLPGAFLLRRGVKKKRRFPWLIIFAVASVLREAGAYQASALVLLAIPILVCALLLPFFVFDLLAAMVSLSALGFVAQLSRLIAVFPAWTGLAEWLAAFAVITLGLASYLAVRGRRVREEEVRPLYAKNLAERLSLQAEVLAAREAQLRLLPQSAPEIPGLQFAACCLPARGVGGDFYDFFRLDAHRVGIFVAQGGDQGLASALCIALAKGVLMHASLQGDSPTQIVSELEASMRDLLEGGSGKGISFAYGVMDSMRNVLSYARIGESPRFAIYREGMGITTSAQLERVVTVPGRSRNAAPIYEGSTHAQTKDILIFFTQGVTFLRSRRFGKHEYQWVDVLMRHIGSADETLQASLLAALSKHQHNASNDLTAVVLRVVESIAVPQEVVA